MLNMAHTGKWAIFSADQLSQGSTLTFETGGPPGPPDANSTRPNSNLGGPV